MSSPTPLKFLMPGWFSLVMGLCGLSLAWHRAVPHWGPVALRVSVGVGVLAGSVFLALLLATLWRAIRFPAAVWDDARHPLRHVFVAALPSSFVLIATVGVLLLLQSLIILRWGGDLRSIPKPLPKRPHSTGAGSLRD